MIGHFFSPCDFNFLRVTDEVANETEKNLGDEMPAVEEDVAGGNKEGPTNEAEEKEPEDKVITQCCLKHCFFIYSISAEHLNFQMFYTLIFLLYCFFIYFTVYILSL